MTLSIVIMIAGVLVLVGMGIFALSAAHIPLMGLLIASAILLVPIVFLIYWFWPSVMAQREQRINEMVDTLFRGEEYPTE